MRMPNSHVGGVCHEQTSDLRSRQVTACDFRNGPIEDVVLDSLTFHRDARGWLAEIFREDELSQGLIPAMAYVSATVPGVTRGPHEHVAQTDLFGFLGPGDFRVKLWDVRENSPTFLNTMVLLLGHSNPATLIVPPGVVHAYRNVSPIPGWVFNAPNRLYAGRGKNDRVDEIRHEQDIDSPFLFEVD